MAKRRQRGQGEGTVFKRKDGRWCAAIYLGYQDGKMKKKIYYGKTRKEAADKLTGALSDLQKGIPIVTERQTVGQFLKRWLEDSVKPSVRLSTYISYNQQTTKHIIPTLGHIWLEKLTPQHLQTYMKDQLEAGLSTTTVRYHRRLLVIALGKALKWGLVARNVASLTDAPKAAKFEIETITPEQARSFFEAIKGDRLEALFAVALSLGLRRGEALGLRWSDIDFESRTLRVNQTLQRLDHELRFSEPKTKSSKRVLALPDTLVSKLREHRTQQLEEKLAAGEHWHDTGLVFTTNMGTPIDPRNIKRKLDALLKAAGLPHCRVHDLRHFSAGLMLAQGVPLKVISDMLGHSQISTTADIYTHVLPALKREAMDIMDSILTGTR